MDPKTVEKLEEKIEEAIAEIIVKMSRLQLAIEQIVFARNYTIGLLDQTPTTRRPSGIDSLHAASVTSPGRWATSPSPSTAWRCGSSGASGLTTLHSSRPNSSDCSGRTRCHNQTRRTLPPNSGRHST